MLRISPHRLVRGVCALVFTSGLLAISSSALADQFTLIDLAWTDPKDATTDSHYFTSPSSQTPKNLKSPVDYSKGSIYFVLDVKTKPSAAQTRFQICMEQDAGYVCPEASPVYTKTGPITWTSQVANFYVGNAGLDWTKPLKDLALILKDQNYNKVGGDPNYYPTELHIQAYMLSAGAKFVPPGTTTSDAGSPAVHPDAGAPSDAGPSTTGAGQGSDTDASLGSDPSGPTQQDASVGTVANSGNDKDAGSKPRVDAAVVTAADGAVEEPSASKSDGGCSLGGHPAQSAGWLLLGLGWMAARRRRLG